MLRPVVTILLSLTLIGCVAQPVDDVDDAPMAQNEQPVSLNLPTDTVAPCAPGDVPASLLERGFSALLDGRHVESISLFQDYKKLEGTEVAAWEADIAIAYDSMLSQSPFYDPVAARAAFGRLGTAPPPGRPVHRNSLMMRDALATFAGLLDSVERLESDNAALAADLARREEAIKRLRELTLGQ